MRRAAAVFVCHSCSHPTKLGNRRSFVNWNCPVSVGGSVRRSARGKTGKKTGNGMKAAFLAAAVLAIAGVAFYFSTTVHAAKASAPAFAEQEYAAQAPAAR